MPKINLTLVDLKFDADNFRKTVHATLEKEIRMAARAWLRAVIPRVPVYTGMARGSLQPLGRFLKVSVPVSPIAKRKDMSPSAGAAQQDFQFEFKDGKYIFRFSSKVAHYKINEFYKVPLPLTNPTPWLSFEAGRAAFKEYVANELPKRLPRVHNYIKPRSIIRKG